MWSERINHIDTEVSSNKISSFLSTFLFGDSFMCVWFQPTNYKMGDFHRPSVGHVRYKIVEISTVLIWIH